MTRDHLSAYVDSELPPEQASEVARHLVSCAECASEYEGILETVSRLQEGLVPYRAPDVLRARIRAAIREEQAGSEPVARRSRYVPWRAIAAAVVIAVVSSGVTFVATGRRAAEPAVAEEVLASHIRSLMPAHLTDVSSNNQHNVKPWFNGRLDFSPSVPRLDDAGFPLLGGRVDYVHGRPVAVVVYGRRQHVINVFSWPAPGRDVGLSQESRNGYTLMHWRRDGVEHWVVSDVAVPDLRQFVALLEQGDAASGRTTPETAR
ncbi:MAG: anti-sigma factor [Gemmatimonadaceae bacterium]|nr:anti-sigma factor [Gemmatimonadaceae bacterium]